MRIVEMDECGRITIPKEEREKLGLKPGQKLILVENDGELILRKTITPVLFSMELEGF